MFISRHFVFMSLALGVVAMAPAQQMATLDSGERVVLHEDGT